MPIFKTIKEKDSMLDLTKNIITNINFFLEHFDFFGNVGYTKEELINYLSKLESVIKMYDENKIPTWFKDYNAYVLTSGDDFTYNKPYLQFCFSFGEFIDVMLSVNKIWTDSKGKENIILYTEIIDRQFVKFIYKKVKSKKDTTYEKEVDKETWLTKIFNNLK